MSLNTFMQSVENIFTETILEKLLLVDEQLKKHKTLQISCY